MKKKLVIDASVAIKLYFEEVHSDTAEKCMSQASQLLAPDLIWVETANVVWKRHQRGEISADDAAQIAEQLLNIPFQIHPSDGLLTDALALAMQYNRTVYDCLYLALAISTKSVMITGDKRFANALKQTPHEPYILSLDTI
jgi:predicted nucleic acid-binding protein